MKDPVVVDYIIVGQGLAGSAVAMQLLRYGRRVLVVDEHLKNTSSQVAAGLFNPITGRNPVKTWLADALFPYLHTYYREAERLTGAKFFFPLPLYRPFATVEEQNEWMGKSAGPAYADYIHTVDAGPRFKDDVNDNLGGLTLRQCGYIDTTLYLSAIRQYVRAMGMEVDDTHFDEDQLQVGIDHVTYRHWKAGKIIFCQGHHTLKGKWFGHLPIRALKGETLTIKTGWEKDVILNRGVYMVPGGTPGQYRVGSTYKYDDASEVVTDEGRQELEGKLRDLIRLPYQVVGHDWGVRPTSPDRRPILGTHPESDRLVVFNGLGTKGVSLAPYFSEVLIRWLENKDPLNKEVAVTRYK